MQNNQNFESFRLSTGGLFYRFFTLLHIQKPGSYSTKRRLTFLIAVCWLPLFLLATIEGNLYNSSLSLPFLYDIKPYVIYLLALPLLIVADTIIDPLIASTLQNISTSGILGENKDKYNTATEKLTQKRDSYFADITILIISIAIVLAYMSNLESLAASSKVTSWLTVQGDADTRLTRAGWWFLVISSPVLQIILFRWFWRFYLWAEFLFRVSRIKLELQPTHPDLAAGLGILKNSESAFILIAFAFGSMLSVSLAEEIIFTEMTLRQAYPVITVYIIASIIIMTLPLFFFTQQLAMARRWGRVNYGDLGYRLSRAFDKKWADPSDQTNGDELLKTADSSVLCDYSDVYNIVREMHIMPFGLKRFLHQAIVLLIPFLPLVFTERSLTDILKRIFETLV